MTARKRPDRAKRVPVRAADELRFRIDAYTPDTMPMARLAEYMAQLANILGEPAAVHFERLEPGSTVLVHRVEREAAPKVRARVTSVRRGEAPSDALRAYRTINKLLREDDGVAVLEDKKAGATIIRFPGREEPEEKFPSVRQQGSVDGEVVWIGGTDETVHVTLRSEDQQISGCWTSKAVAKQLAQRLFEPVRVFGIGRWSRDADGKWSLLRFKIESFEALKDTPLSIAVSELRAIPTDWDEGTYDELQLIRHGPPERRNGGH